MTFNQSGKIKENEETLKTGMAGRRVLVTGKSSPVGYARIYWLDDKERWIGPERINLEYVIFD